MLARPVMLYPASTNKISPVIPAARSEHKKAAALPTSSVVTFFLNGAASAALLSMDLKLLMPTIVLQATLLLLMEYSYTHHQ